MQLVAFWQYFSWTATVDIFRSFSKVTLNNGRSLRSIVPACRYFQVSIWKLQLLANDPPAQAMIQSFALSLMLTL